MDKLIGRSPSTHSICSSTLVSESAPDFAPLLFGGTPIELFPPAQSQFEKYAFLDTEEIVHQVKDFLAKNAVRQRQFGENVFGLSRGSISDLRPKAWDSEQYMAQAVHGIWFFNWINF